MVKVCGTASVSLQSGTAPTWPTLQLDKINLVGGHRAGGPFILDCISATTARRSGTENQGLCSCLCLIIQDLPIDISLVLYHLEFLNWLPDCGFTAIMQIVNTIA